MTLSRRSRLWAARLVLAGCSMLVTLVAIEFAYRAWAYREYTNRSYYGIVVQSRDPMDGETTGFYVPGPPVRYRMFDLEHNLLMESTYPINEQGYISHYNYELEKAPGEFRVAVLGDSFTACVNNDKPWPDSLRERLNADEQLKRRLGATHFTVMSFGAPGAGFPMFVREYVEHAQIFQPDLVIVNYIEEDFVREPGRTAQTVVERCERNSLTPNTTWNAKVEIDGVSVRVIGANKQEITRYANPLDCPGVSPTVEFTTSDERLAFDKEHMQAVKARVAADYLRTRLWRSWRPHALYRALGQPLTFSSYSHFIASKCFSVENDALTHATECIDLIASRHPQLVLLRNPVHADLEAACDLRYTERLRASRPHLHVVDMRHFLPADASPEEQYGWYNLPHDGHWSNAGAEIYAAAVHVMLSQPDRRLAARAGSDTH